MYPLLPRVGFGTVVQGSCRQNSTERKDLFRLSRAWVHDPI
jgi:hypothetical protein